MVIETLSIFTNGNRSRSETSGTESFLNLFLKNSFVAVVNPSFVTFVLCRKPIANFSNILKW